MLCEGGWCGGVKGAVVRGMVWRNEECCGEGGWCGGVKSVVVRGMVWRNEECCGEGDGVEEYRVLW